MRSAPPTGWIAPACGWRTHPFTLLPSAESKSRARRQCRGLNPAGHGDMLARGEDHPSKRHHTFPADCLANDCEWYLHVIGTLAFCAYYCFHEP